jgi:hypothetical protein
MEAAKMSEGGGLSKLAVYGSCEYALLQYVARSSVFAATILGGDVPVSLTIRASFEASFDFSMNGVPYSLTVTSWSRRGFAKFASLFFAHKERDASEFGTLVEDADGTPVFRMTTAQKLNVITHGVKDIMRCIDAIASRHPRSVLDYAVWYCEKHPAADTYVDFITLHACHCMVNADFLAPIIS